MESNRTIEYQYVGDVSSSNSFVVFLVCLSLIFNVFLYRILPKSIDALRRSYIVSTVHAIICVVCVIGFFLCFSVDLRQTNRISGGGVDGTGDQWMIYNICFSLGYFLYDLILMFIFPSIRSLTAIIHHLIIFLGFYSGIFYRICHPCHFYLLGEELSTIPLNLKMIFRDRPQYHQILTYLFVISFIFCRLFYGSLICFYAFRTVPEYFHFAQLNNDRQRLFLAFIQMSLCVLSRILNLYWSFLIFKKLFSSKSSPKKSN